MLRTGYRVVRAGLEYLLSSMRHRCRIIFTRMGSVHVRLPWVIKTHRGRRVVWPRTPFYSPIKPHQLGSFRNGLGSYVPTSATATQRLGAWTKLDPRGVEIDPRRGSTRFLDFSEATSEHESSETRCLSAIAGECQSILSRAGISVHTPQP
jgi:hypothetical protein